MKNQRTFTRDKAAGLLLAVLAFWLPQTSFGADAFLDGFDNFRPANGVVDANGFTYIVGSRSGAGLIKRYDSSGGSISITNIPSAVGVTVGSNNLLYVASANTVVRMDRDGNLVGGGYTNNNITIRGIVYSPELSSDGLSIVGTIYICGTVNSSGRGFLMKRSPNLATEQGYKTFGIGSGNIAYSVAVDNAGDVYVSGNFGTGGGLTMDFAVEGATSGGWSTRRYNSGAGIPNLSTALGVISSQPVTASNNFSTINFGSGGHFGGDAAFPGGGGDHFVTQSRGQFYVGVAGTYTFYSSSDDGARLSINGSPVYDDTGLHPAYDPNFSVPVALSQGIHSLEYIQFENEGSEAAELSWNYGGSQILIQAASLAVGAEAGGRGFVLKVSKDISTLKAVYVSNDGRVAGTGAIYDLQFVGGWIYAIGHWNGVAVNSELPADTSILNDIEVLKLDTGLRLSGRATVKGADNQAGHKVTADSAGNVYFCGSYGANGRVDFIGSTDRVPGGTDSSFTQLSSAKPGRFVAKLNPNMSYAWVRTPVITEPTFSASGGTTPDAVVRWNEFNQKLFWGLFAIGGTLTVGDPGSYLALPAAQTGFITVLESDGTFAQRVRLTIISQYGQGGTQVLPFGGTPDIPVTELRIKGAQIIASVPRFIYRNIDNQELVNPTPEQIAQQAQIRFAATGYSLDDGVTTGTGENYSFSLQEDTVLEFHWRTEYALSVDSDLSGTLSGPGGLTSLSSGNPEPPVQKNWIVKDELVIATIDGVVLDINNFAGKVRYVPIGYAATGSANSWAVPGDLLTVDFFAFDSIQTRQQVPQFAMRGPATITYQWKRQNAVEVATTGFQSSGLPLVRVTDNSGQPDSPGVGTFWYDEHTALEIGTVKKRSLQEVRGWFNGDGTIFAQSGVLSNLTATFTNQLEIYVSKRVPSLNHYASVMWDYGDRIFEQTNFIGNFVHLDTNTIDDAGVLSRLRIDTEPASLTVEQSLTGAGTTAADMAIWDPQGHKLYPLREGRLLAQWRTTDIDPNARVLIRIHIKYPPQPHYRHVANTPPVDLEPDATDNVVFKEIKYTENSATVDGDQGFIAGSRGKTVLLFGEKTAGRGDQVETYRVRVVETKLYTDGLISFMPATIGEKITSVYDTAGLGSGWVVFPNARYNPFIYNRDAVTGPIIPVNLEFTGEPTNLLTVVWYEKRDKIHWPHQAVSYNPQWPTYQNGLNRIVIASRYGSESVASNGTDQVISPAMMIGTNSYPKETTLNPSRFQQAQIYQQGNPNLPGYNPNEEHAVMAPSLRYASVSPRPSAAYALRTGDLNETNRSSAYTSDPYVLVQFFDAAANEYKMRVFSIFQSYTNNLVGELSYEYGFRQEMEAGEPVIPFYPLPQVIGATPCLGTYGKDGAPLVRKTFWKDHKGTGWAISGDGFFSMYFYYPLSPDFWWPPTDPKIPGDCVAWLPHTRAFSPTNFPIDYTKPDQTPPAQEVVYTTVWPDNLPILKVGETLTFAGGEYRRDHPTTPVLNEFGDIVEQETPGLPGVLAWASGEVVYDTLNPTMNDQTAFGTYSVRLYPALEQRAVALSLADFPAVLAPATQRTKVEQGKYVFVELPSSLQRRVTFDPLLGKLVLVGLLNDKDIGDPTLTAPPPAVYVLEPNVLTASERDAMLDLAPSSTKWTEAVTALYKLSRNPNLLDRDNNGETNTTSAYYPGLTKADNAYRVGLEQKIQFDPATGLPLLKTNLFSIVSKIRSDSQAAPVRALGPGLALFANPDFLNPLDTTDPISYVTVAENNDESLGGSPVVLHIIKVDKRQRYRGAIKTILSDNVFDENIILRHTADFGGNADALKFEWWYRPEDGTEAPTPEVTPAPSPWKLFADPSGEQGRGFYQLTLKGNPSAPEALLADTLFYVRYRHVNDEVSGINWNVPQPNGASRVPYEWAGAANSTPQIPIPQLAQGWVKRVLDAVNPYEARIRDFSGDNPATYSSMIRQLGPKFEGPVALNPDKNVIENVGLIALYETILKRARDLSIDLSTPISTPAIANALELASTRLSDFYMLLGNEAYSDAVNPSITRDEGTIPAYVFSFQNQMATLADEELALLRGIDGNNATPVYNRLFWNFTKGEGEAAYAINYNVTDVNNDAFIDEDDAMILYPQGHGDAWGHYLTAAKMQYDLLRHPYFNWVSRSEFYNLQDVVIPVDFLDERKFAEVAAAKAKAGSDIFNLTYRAHYVEDPEAQWQGYLDTNPERAWGVEEWAHRAGQGAYFDWVTANALLPAVHPNTNYAGIQKVDRTTVNEIAVISANLNDIQLKIDEANRGYNPLGIDRNGLVFDIDSTFLFVGSTAQIGTRAVQGLFHFDQIYERALGALANASAAYSYATELENKLRDVANNEEEFRQSVIDQDLAFRNQLIEIFGTPYEGTIGAGKAFPPGYQGPDTTLHMYVDVRKITHETVPRPTMSYTNDYVAEFTSTNARFTMDQGVIPHIPDSFRLRHAEQFDPAPGYGVIQNINYTDFSQPLRVEMRDLNLPISTAGYSFQALPEWGRRASPGELQSLLNQLLQAEADVASAIAAWDSLSAGIVHKLRLINAQYDNDKGIRDLMKAQIAITTTLNAIKQGFSIASGVAEVSGEAVQDFGDVTMKGIPQNTPIAGLAFSAGDAFAPLKLGIGYTAEAAKGVLIAQKIVFAKIAEATEFFKELSVSLIALQQDSIQRDYAMKQSLTELYNMVGDEGVRRVQIFKAVQTMRDLSEQYRAKVSQGNRLIEERTIFNKRAASMTQRRRYHDMTFRVARNAALEKYRSAFDVASKYTYLAAKAYDYDTNLDPNHPGHPRDIINDIVRQRSVGAFEDRPLDVGGGLAADLVWLKFNYDALKTSMGIINPQLEAATFSLRNECFRTANGPISDEIWKQTLRSPNVFKQDLWQVPEFRQYCRPFAPESDGPQPGLMIPFSTEIRSGRNFFGWPLGGGDTAYDPSIAITKIASVGVGFATYDGSLATAPRAYLVPVGMDVMTIPYDQDLKVRLWDVVDQRIPVPYPALSANLANPTWKPLTDSLSGQIGEIRQYSGLRAYGFEEDVDFQSLIDTGTYFFDTRLIARSVWNTRWLLIIPGATLGADPAVALETFIDGPLSDPEDPGSPRTGGVSDIKLFINTYAVSGN